MAPNSSHTFRHTTEGEITKIIKSLNPKKSTGPDQIPPKLIKIARPQISNVLTGMINNALDEEIFPGSLKRAQVTPVFKKADNLSKENYRPVSILPCLSKIFERVIANRLNEYFEGIFHESLSAFRSGYSCQDTLLALVEKWKSTFRKNKCAGAILMDLSKAFDCMHHDLLTAKLDAYGITTNSLKLLKSYLTNRQQRVKIGNATSEWKDILKGVPQGSILGPILFNIFINDMFHFIARADLVNYADDNTICSEQPTKQQVVEVLRAELNLAIEWFTRNLMLANPQKFQALFLNCKEENFTFDLDNVTIIPDDVVKLLGVHLDSKLNFENHISHICKKLEIILMFSSDFLNS